ncbi:MAG: hypothetical protein ABWX88_08475 [Pseudoxanthomonas sp.]
MLRVGLFALLGVFHAAPSSAGELTEIRITQAPVDGAGKTPSWVQKAPFQKRQEIILELGDDPYGAVVQLDTQAKPELHAYRISVQFETSLAIGDEGPHVDLLDWKHCTSAWKIVEVGEDGGFVLPKPTEAESTCFPAATKAEIKTAVRSALRRYGMDDSGGEHWLELADSVNAPGELPSYIGVSKVRVRIEKRIERSWKEVTTIELMPPMGC